MSRAATTLMRAIRRHPFFVGTAISLPALLGPEGAAPAGASGWVAAAGMAVFAGYRLRVVTTTATAIEKDFARTL